MTETYRNKQAADAAAKEYAWEKLHEHYECSRHEAGNMIEIAYWHILGRGSKVGFEVKSFFFEPQPEIKKDTPVWVKCIGGWLPRYATGEFNSEGQICCYSDGKASFTADRVSFWSEYSLTDPYKKEQVKGKEVHND